MQFGRDTGEGARIAREKGATPIAAGLIRPSLLRQIIEGILARHPGAYVPGWPGVIVATEKGEGITWIAYTDEDAILIEPTKRTATPALSGEPLPWPETQAGIVAVEAEPAPDTNRGYDDDDGNGDGNGNGNGAPAPLPLGMLAAAAAAAFLLLRK